jgi:hypothetical protein
MAEFITFISIPVKIQGLTEKVSGTIISGIDRLGRVRCIVPDWNADVNCPEYVPIGDLRVEDPESVPRLEALIKQAQKKGYLPDDE